MSESIELQSRTDPDLIERCLQLRDRDSFALLVERHQNLVCSVVYNILGDLGRSGDVAQETFLAAWRKLASLEEPGWGGS
jgi:RNA polymerase sigma-70 factor (ECF subfamily)